MASLALARLEALDNDGFERRHKHSLLSRSCPDFGKAAGNRPTSASSITHQSKQRSRLKDALRASHASEGELPTSPGRGFGRKPNLVIETRTVQRPRSRPATAGSSAVWSLSHETQVQNTKTEKAEARLDEYREMVAAEGAARGAITPKPKAMEPAVQINTHFEEELKSFEGELHELGRRIRLEGMMDEKSAKFSEEERRRAEEKKQREEAARRLRQAAKEAQNPKKRVLLRMEEQRHNMEAGEADTVGIAAKVPMKNFELASGSAVSTPSEKLLKKGQLDWQELQQDIEDHRGDHRRLFEGFNLPPYRGREVQSNDGRGPGSPALVDVQMLQTKALGLNVENKTFKTIYGLACDHEKRVAWEAEAYGAPETRQNHVKKNSAPGGDSVMSRSKTSMQSQQSQKMLRNEQRQMTAQRKRREKHEQKTLHLMASMRSCIDMDEGMCCNGDTLKALKDITYVVAQAHIKGKTHELTGSFKRRAQSLHSTETILSLPTPQNLRKVSRALWGALRGVLFVVCLLAAQRRRWASDRVRNFCHNLTQYDQIKRAVRQWNVKRRRLADKVRAFMMKKNKWYDKVSREWERIEDKFLSTAYIKNPFGSSEQPQVQPSLSRSLNVDTAKLYTDERWMALRIPAKQRKFALGRWYFLQLRKKVQSQTGWTLTVGDSMMQTRDLQRFFQLCGHSEFEHEEVETPCQKSQPSCGFRSRSSLHSRHPNHWGHHHKQQAPDLFEFGDQEINEMIASLAHSLRDVAPFQLHPCNAKKEKPRRKMSRYSSTHSEMGDTAQSRAHSESDVSSKVKETSAEEFDLDLEELFRRFTPRLRQIREAQANCLDTTTGSETDAFWKEADEAALRLREADM